MRGKPKKGKQAKCRRWRIKRACFEEGPRFPCALHPETGGATGRKNLFFPLPLFSELVKVLKIFDFNGAGHPSWVSRTHPFFPSRKSPLAALRLFPLLGFSAHTLHPQGVCGIRRAAKPLTAALPYHRREFTILLTVSCFFISDSLC